jgi:hypothetical protein
MSSPCLSFFLFYLILTSFCLLIVGVKDYCGACSYSDTHICCRTPLDEWSARYRDPYLTTHNSDNRLHARGGIRTRNPRRWVAADRAATGICPCMSVLSNKATWRYTFMGDRNIHLLLFVCSVLSFFRLSSGINLTLQSPEDRKDKVIKCNSLYFFVIKICNGLEEGYKIFPKI